MFNVQIIGLDKAIATLIAFPKKLQAVKESALHKTGQATMANTRSFIESQGAGSWPKPHPLSTSFKNKGTRWQQTDRPANFVGLGKFSRYIVGKDFLITGFGSREKTGKAKFNPVLMKYAKTLDGGNIPVTQKMRRKLGATRIYPIRRTTNTIIIPRRLIKFNIDASYNIFVKILESSFDKRID